MIGFREAKKAKRKSLLTTAGWNSVILSPVWRQIAEKLRKMEARVGAGWNSVVLSSYDDGRSAVGGLLPVFQSASAGNNSTADLSSSSVAGIGEEESRLIFTEPLLDGGVRFVFAVPAVEEFGIEETPDLLEKLGVLCRRMKSKSCANPLATDRID